MILLHIFIQESMYVHLSEPYQKQMEWNPLYRYRYTNSKRELSHQGAPVANPSTHDDLDEAKLMEISTEFLGHVLRQVKSVSMNFRQFAFINLDPF